MTKQAEEVSYKSTKSDIWKAYKEALDQLAGPSEKQDLPAAAKAIGKTANTLRDKLGSSVEDLLNQFDEAREALERLSQAKEKAREELVREEEEAKKRREREEEEWSYDFERRKKRQNEELVEARASAESEIAARKQALKEAEDELSSLRTQVAGFEKLLEDKVKEATERVTLDLTTKFGHEREILEKEKKAQGELSAQKIASLESIVKSRDAEIGQLREALREAQGHLSKIAQRAVEKAPEVSKE